MLRAFEAHRQAGAGEMLLVCLAISLLAQDRRRLITHARAGGVVKNEPILVNSFQYSLISETNRLNIAALSAYSNSTLST